MKFDGWGSKPLINFLKEIGIETEQPISQQDLSKIVDEYVKKNNLIGSDKKKRVKCDKQLCSLFRKKFILRLQIHQLLYQHLAENRDDSEEEDSPSSEDNIENETTVSRKRKSTDLEEKVAPNSDKVHEIQKNCFASIISENIKLVYLRRDLVQELLKDPDTFERKVVGSYVRIRNDRNDYSQKNPYQLLQVIGVKMVPECSDAGAKCFLQVMHLLEEIPISMLANGDIREEECEDLYQRILAGYAHRPTVMELQIKAHMLHKDITNEWIGRRLISLGHLIEQANIKGWRKELYEHLESKALLQKPAERERLLLALPNVVGEVLEPEAMSSDHEANKGLSNPNSCGEDPSDNDGNGNGTYKNDATLVKEADVDKSDRSVQEQTQYSNEMHSVGKLKEPQVIEKKHQPVNNEEKGKQKPVNSIQEDGSVAQTLSKVDIIELSDDDDSEKDLCDSSLWYYADFNQDIQGPFRLRMLKMWKDAGYFPSDFKVWKRGQSPLLLNDVVSEVFK